jgi:hypothetical protein
MEKYIAQLLECLKQATEDLPQNYPHHMDTALGEEHKWISELAKVPYKPIEEWTGVEKNKFPPSEKLTEEQKADLVVGMGEVLAAYHIDYDCKEDMKTADLHYRILVECWDEPVQYLPESGFDLEICAGDEAICWLGEECFCLHNPPNFDFDEPPILPPAGEERDLSF